MADSTERSHFEITRRMFGADWLGPLATLDEYAVASWFEENGWKHRYIYQAPVGDFRNQLWTDFLLLGTAPRICIEVNGDKWHSGIDQQSADRRRTIGLEQQGYIVVAVYGHDIYQYKGHPPPTDASFDNVMKWAVQGVQISKP
jgi:hypothetical protein